MDEIRWSNGRIGRRGHDRALRKRADRSGKWTNHVPSLPPSRNQPSPFAPSACFWSYHPWIPSAQHLPLSRSAPFIFPSARVYVSPFENVAKSFFSFQTSRSPTVVEEGTIPENLPCLQTRNQSRESRHLRVNSFNEIYVFLFEIEGLFYAVTIAIAHYYAL